MYHSLLVQENAVVVFLLLGCNFDERYLVFFENWLYKLDIFLSDLCLILSTPCRDLRP